MSANVLNTFPDSVTSRTGSANFPSRIIHASPATELTESFDGDAFRTAIAVGNHKQTPLSLYCHIPFCATPCYFCGCNTIITQRKQVAEPYLGYLALHIRQVAQLVHPDRVVHQLHWGGGTPNYLDLRQVEFLWDELNHYFSLDDTAEVSIEVNPCYVIS